VCIWRQSQEAAGVLETEAWNTFRVDIEAIDNQYTTICRHPRLGHRCDIQSLKHSHGIKLVEAQIRRVVIGAFDDVAGRANGGLAR
jgi:hypothetical protein